jgi:predicted dehydrogenase
MGSSAGRLGVGLVGSGFMGRAHAFAFNAVAQVFDPPLRPELAVLADRTGEIAGEVARSLGFARAVGDWRALVEDASVDVVAITAPNALHKPVALAAFKAGKHVYCEKPLATTLVDACAMAEAAEASGRVGLVGFNYLKNPIIALAREIVQSGEIGEPVAFRGIHAEDYMMDPEAPHGFRTDPEGGGALMDIGSHIVSMARYLVGPIEEVTAATATVHQTRPAEGGRRPVPVDDHGHFVARFANGALGTLSASWVAAGRKMQLEFELTGTRGTLAFSQERFNELQIYAVGADRPARDGFRTILSGPATPPYGHFCPAPGHQLGFNDLKTIEVAHLIAAIAGEETPSPDFREAYEIQRTIAAALGSARERAWVRVDSL